MITIHVDNNYSKVVSGNLPNGSTAFFVKQYVTKKRRKGQVHPETVKKRITLFNNTHKRFPTGLLYQFEDYLKEHFPSVKVKIEDRRRLNLHGKVFPTKHHFIPYTHQNEGVEITDSYSRGIFVCPTGSGKTYIAQAIIKKFGLRSLYLVSSIDLLQQTVESFEKAFFNTEIGIIGNNEYKPKEITIATVQTLWSRLNRKEVMEYLKSIDVLIGDEIHHVAKGSVNFKPKNKDQPKELFPGNSLYRVLQSIDAYYRYGFSAKIGHKGTLRRWFMESTIGRPIYHTNYKLLRDKGVLANGIVFVIKTPPLVRLFNYNETYTKNIQQNTWVHETIAFIVKQLGIWNKTSVIIVNRLRIRQEDGSFKTGHGGLLYNTLHKYIGDMVLLTGGSPSHDRRVMLKKLIKKELKVAVGTILKEGIDIPTLDVTIYACGGRAETSLSDESDSMGAIQSFGRALRNPGGLEDQKNAVHIDFYFDDEGGMLSRHSEERILAYKESGYDVRDVSKEGILGAMHEWFNNSSIQGSFL